MRHVERGADLLQVAFGLLRGLTAPLRGRRDAKRPQQLLRGGARITRLAEDRMQSLAHQMVKDEIDDAPGVEGLGIGGLAVAVHGPTQRRLARKGGLNLRQCPATRGLLCKRRVTQVEPSRLGLRPENELGGGGDMAQASTPPVSKDRLAEARDRFLAAESVDPAAVRKPILASW